MALPKVNLSEMLSSNGNGNYNLSISKANGNAGIIVNVSANYDNPDTLINIGNSETYVYEGTDSEILTKLNTLGFNNVAEVNP